MAAGIQLPPGFRFHPTDDELVTHYLCRKSSSLSITVPIIAEIDLYKYDPWDLPDLALYGEKEWYFFTHRDRKYPNGSRPNRAAGSGYWKATGADKPIGQPKPVAIKKALVFYAGKAPRGDKTNWIMHEYRMADVDRSADHHVGRSNKGNGLRLDDWVLCRIYNKKGTVEKQTPDEDSKPDTPSLPLLTHHNLHDTMSDSVPRFHPDSSGSDHAAASPTEFKEEVVESQPRHTGEEDDTHQKATLGFPFNYLDTAMDEAFLSPFQANINPLHDMFLFSQ